jgi:hypothetical protein
MNDDLAPSHLRRIFYKKLTRNLAIGTAIILFSLGLGMAGYAYFEKMGWVDAYVNAVMILSGMGPVDTLQTDEGKIFAGSYALFSGIIFLVVIGFILIPVFHRLFHKFHIEELERGQVKQKKTTH